jgi:hypothetical protein
MRRRVARTVVGAFLFAGAAWSALVAGCSTNNDATSGGDDASLTCPGSIAQAVDSPCSPEGHDCPIGYTCGAFPQQSHCVCTKGKYVCTDATGTAIAKGGQPQCVGLPPPNSKECPAAESGTDEKVCHTAGLICYYTGVQCPENDQPFVDHCQCVGSASSDSGLAFDCEPQTCNPRSDASDDSFRPPDTGPPPSDGGKDS